MINLRQEALDALVDKALGTTSLIGIPTVVRRGLFVTRKWPRRLLTFVPRSQTLVSGMRRTVSHVARGT